MIERNSFDNALRDLALRHAPVQVAKCGDTVTAQWGDWKVPHKVKITSVSIEISDIHLTIGRRAELGLTGWLIVQHQYVGRRIKANGDMVASPETGFLLSEFTTVDGQHYQRIPSCFNHIGLVFDSSEFGVTPNTKAHLPAKNVE